MIGWGNATGTTGTYSNFTNISGSVNDILSFSSQKNNAQNNPTYNSTDKELRLYYNSNGNGNSITITPAEKVTFTGFTMVTNTTPTVKYFVDGGSGTVATRSSYTYSADGFEATTSLKIQNANTSNTQLRISTILITYTVEDTSDKIVNSLTATYSGGDVYVGGSLDTSAVFVTAKFTNSTKYPDEPLASTDYSLSGFSSQTAGTKEVTVTYTGEYSTSTPTVTTSFNVTVIEDTVVDVSVSCSKSTFHPGETISKSNLTVTLIYQSGNQMATNDYEFSDNNYQFTYDDAPSGGVAKSKQFSIIYAQNSYNFSVNVTRIAYQEIPSETDTLNRAFTGVTKDSTSYSNWSGKEGASGAIYAGNSAGGSDSIQLRSSNSNSGIVMTSSGGKATKIVVTWQSSTTSGRVLNVYGKNTAYSSASDLYNSSSQGTLIGTIVYGTSTELVISGDYSFIGLRSNSGAMYLSEIKIYIGGGADNPTNVSNFIMYEDTEGQCEGKDGKLNQAIAKLNTMSDADKELFSTSNDYVISTARTRLNAWAKHEGKVINLTNNGFVLSSSPSLIEPIKMSTDNNVIMTVVVVTTCFVAVLGGFIYLKKREEK